MFSSSELWKLTGLGLYRLSQAIELQWHNEIANCVFFLLSGTFEVKEKYFSLTHCICHYNSWRGCARAVREAQSQLSHNCIPCGVIFILIFVSSSFSDTAMECVHFCSSCSLCFPSGGGTCTNTLWKRSGIETAVSENLFWQFEWLTAPAFTGLRLMGEIHNSSRVLFASSALIVGSSTAKAPGKWSKWKPLLK